MINEFEIEQQKILTVKDAAQYLRVSEMTVLRLAQQGVIRGSKVGRQWRFIREEVMQLIQPNLI